MALDGPTCARGRGARLPLMVILLAAIPHAAYAQAAIAGLVKDPSGSPLPGVIVEAISPALIERVRTTLSDGSGRYRIEDMRPGTYRVRFTLKGWQTYELQGIEVTGSATVTVNAELAMGLLTAEITVEGRTPVIDVHGAGREVTLSAETVRGIPTARSYNALLVLLPGVVTNVNDTIMETATASFPMHGGRANEGRLLLDGMNIGSPPSGNSATSYVIDVGNAHEITFATAGTPGESETAGLQLKIIPRSGGNSTRGSFFASGSGRGLQSDNLTEDLEVQGVMSAPFSSVYDVSGVLGGPVVKDRLWYFVNGHVGGSRRESTNVFYNLNAGDPGTWLYAADPARRSYSDRTFENASARLTWQVAPRHRIGAFWDAQSLCRTCTGATPGLSEPQRISPEAVGVLGRRLDVTQVTWWSPVTNRLVLEAGFSGTYFGVGNFEREPNPTRDLIRVSEQCASGCAANGGIPGLVYRSQDFSDAHSGSFLWKATASYVTGTLSVKGGYQHTLMTDDRTWWTNTQNLTYRFNNGVPDQLTQSISPWVNNARAAWDGVFVQAQTTRGRLTLHGAVRFDRARSWFPRQQLGPSRFLLEPIVIPKTRGVDSYKDVSPRMGLAYDLFGTGKTALRLSVGRYLEGAGVTGNYANTNPTLRMPQTTSVFGTAGVTRAWNDANGNLVPDCDLMNPAGQDLRAVGGDMCGGMSNTRFGQNVLTNNFDPAALDGWGVRPSDWHVGASIDHQVGARSSITVAYTRRTFEGFFVADNLALTAADLTPFTLTAPLDPRLPGGGGYPIGGLYDVVPEKAGHVSNLVVDSAKYGAWHQYFNAVDVTINVRPTRDLTLIAGSSTGQTVADNCDVRMHLPELATTTTGTSTFGAGLLGSPVTPVSPYCHVAFGILTQFRGLASYTVPKAGIQVSAVFQSKPGPMLVANYAAPNADVAPSLGRNLSGDAANVTVNVLAPGSMYGDRITQLDVRVAKRFKVGSWRTTLGLDLYNALNSSAVLSYNPVFVPGGPGFQPLTILTPRFIRFTGEVDF